MATAREMIAVIEESLLDNIGVREVSSDGQTVVFSREQALLELEYWKRKAAVESGRRGLFRGVNLGSAW